MSRSAAAVVDLNEFRRQRARPEPRAATPMRPALASVPVPLPVPVVVCWVPVWVVA